MHRWENDITLLILLVRKQICVFLRMLSCSCNSQKWQINRRDREVLFTTELQEKLQQLQKEEVGEKIEFNIGAGKIDLLI